MEDQTIWAFAASIAASTAAAIIAAKWSRANKQEQDVAELKARMESVNREKNLEFRAVEHRLVALEHEQKLTRDRYHELRSMVIKCLARMGFTGRNGDDEG